MTTKPNRYFWIIFLMFLAACAPVVSLAPTETPMPTVTFTPVPPTITPTLELIPVPATVMPTQLPIPMITPDPVQVERWREYEDELAKLVLSDSGTDFRFYETALCEWDILGRSYLEVYVWAECAFPGSGGRGPAVIYIEEDGSIRDVKYAFPSPSRDVTISRLFPEDIQAKIYTYFSSEWSKELQRHLSYRLAHPEELPLIVLSVMPTATPTP